MVICLERGADLHTAQLMPLPLTVSCFSKIQIGFTFLVPAQISSPGKGPLNGYVLVNLLFSVCFATGYIHLGEIKILNSYTGDGVINVLFFTLHPPIYQISTLDFNFVSLRQHDPSLSTGRALVVVDRCEAVDPVLDNASHQSSQRTVDRTE